MPALPITLIPQAVLPAENLQCILLKKLTKDADKDAEKDDKKDDKKDDEKDDEKDDKNDDDKDDDISSSSSLTPVAESSLHTQKKACLCEISKKKTGKCEAERYCSTGKYLLIPLHHNSLYLIFATRFLIFFILLSFKITMYYLRSKLLTCFLEHQEVFITFLLDLYALCMFYC